MPTLPATIRFHQRIDQPAAIYCALVWLPLNTALGGRVGLEGCGEAAQVSAAVERVAAGSPRSAALALMVDGRAEPEVARERSDPFADGLRTPAIPQCRISHSRIPGYSPLDPNPLAPRAASDNSSSTTSPARNGCSSNWAILSPLRMVYGSSPRFSISTMISPR